MATLEGCGPPARPRNAVLIVLDTLRADRLSAYGYPRETSPVIDRLARDGVLFETVVSNSSWTLPSMVGLLSGDLPTPRVFTTSLERSLVERIRDAGWKTAAFVEGGFVSRSYGIDRGFDDFQEGEQRHLVPGKPPPVGPSVTIDETFDAARDWLAANAEEPFFLLVHTYEPHTPYNRHVYTEGLDRGEIGEAFEILDAALVIKGLKKFEEVERNYVRALYDGGVAESDRHVGELLATLEELGIADETVILVTSDHGEDLGGREPEAPGTHGHTVYDELLLVPLILYDPTREYPVARVTAQVRTIDTLHTVLDLLDIPAEANARGRSLVPFMEGRETQHRFAWSKVPYSEYFGYPARFSLRTGSYKLILNPPPPAAKRVPGRSAGPRIELYDLQADARERRNLASQDSDRRDILLEQLTALRRDLEADGVPKYLLKRGGSADVGARLRELGYIE
jgi:arylsulfatase A-like enzyme